MKTKEEVIKEKWIEIIGEENFKKLNVDENGFEDHYTYATKTSSAKEHTEKHFDIDKNTGLIRPKSLQGIESNNGWISINSEKDLPSEDEFYWVFDGLGIYFSFFKSKHKEFIDQTDNECAFYNITHYQPIVKPLKPIHK